MFWLVLAGRGFGKTRLAMEDAAWYGITNPGARIHLVAATYSDARDTLIEGNSGLRDILAPELIDTWNRSLGELILKNGTRYKLFAATEPERLRGPQCHRAYCDELAAWERPETLDQLLFGLRLGTDPRVIIATTPKPTPLVRRIMNDAKTIVTRGSTFDNSANLAASALEQLKAKYEGTRLGRQELYAEVLEDIEGALWTRDWFDKHRIKAAPQLKRVVVAIDPSGARSAFDEKSDSIGVVVAGKGADGRAYVLADRSLKASPAEWGRVAVRAYQEFQADRIIAERNYGGAMVEHVIRTTNPSVPFTEVVASRGKAVRAEPVAALYEQGRVSHVGAFDALEDQACMMTTEGYLGEGSPDRLDAMVWALTELMLGEIHKPARFIPASIMGR